MSTGAGVGRSRNARSTTKRLMDLAISIPLVVLTSPLLMLAALLIKLVDRGPAFYTQEREGLDGRVFRLWKLRTMYVDSDERLARFLAEHPERREEWETLYKLEQDPRVLPRIGQFLRRSSIDELPNLFNVIRGDLSIVGPRPFPGYHLQAFEPEFLAVRRTVRPGITGLWQLERGGLDVQRRADTEYISQWSMLLDVRILLQTVPRLLLARKEHY